MRERDRERKRDKDRRERDLSIFSRDWSKRRVSGSSIIRVPVSNY